MKMERIKSSETSEYKKQTPGNHPKENIKQFFMLLMLIAACSYLARAECVNLHVEPS
jgi:hypothetical protein